MNEQTTRRRMIASDLVEKTADGARIVAWRRKTDGKIVFPRPGQEGEQASYERLPLSPRGELWSWTVQRFRPKSPPYVGPEGDAFQPYAVGYVEFPEGIIVEGRIDAVVGVDELRVGMPMETTVIPIFTDTDGEIVEIYAFRRADSSGAAARG